MKSQSSLQLILSSLLFFVCVSLKAQKASDFYAIIDAVSEERIEQDIATLAGFGTRHTLSDTLSTKEELERHVVGYSTSFKALQKSVTAALRFLIKKIMKNQTVAVL